MNIRFLCIPIAVILSGNAFSQEPRTVKVTVSEENGGAVEGATVSIGYLGYSGKDDNHVNGQSNGAGVFSATAVAKLDIRVMVSKDGYYESLFERLGNNQNHEVSCILRKIINPTALFAKRTSLYFPENRKWIGYDFEAGDWVAPNGNGKNSDVFFKCDTHSSGRGAFEIKFGDDEGLKLQSEGYLPESSMKLPHEAPKTGYTAFLNRNEQSYLNANFVSNVGYFFRVRVKKRGGEIQSANYGKILSDFRFDPRESGWHVSHKNRPKSFGSISFTYYFNSKPNDRNLEFDAKNNLFRSLNRKEIVKDP